MIKLILKISLVLLLTMLVGYSEPPQNKTVKTIKISLESEKDVDDAMKMIKSDNEKLYGNLSALKKSNKKRFMQELRREYYNLVLRRKYQAVTPQRKKSGMELQRINEKKLRDLVKIFKKETDKVKKQTIEKEMVSIAAIIFNGKMQKEARYISGLKRKLKIVQGKYEHNIKNKESYIKRIVNDHIK